MRKHAVLIKKWLDNPEMRIENKSPNDTKWELIPKNCEPNWFDYLEYREYDPFRKFKEAEAAGKTIQYRSLVFDDEWSDIENPSFDRSVDNYRIKSEHEPEAPMPQEPKFKVGDVVVVKGYHRDYDCRPLVITGTIVRATNTYCNFTCDGRSEPFANFSVRNIIGKYVPFSVEDAELFKGKYVRLKENPENVYLVIAYSEIGITCIDMSKSFNDAFEYLKFSDGTPFGKLQII